MVSTRRGDSSAAANNHDVNGATTEFAGGCAIWNKEVYMPLANQRTRIENPVCAVIWRRPGDANHRTERQKCGVGCGDTA